MKLLTFTLVLAKFGALGALGCAATPPPPIVCEPPAPQPKNTSLGMCPISYVDAGPPPDASGDSGYDAPQ